MATPVVEGGFADHGQGTGLTFAVQLAYKKSEDRVVYDANLECGNLIPSAGAVHAYFGVFDGHNGPKMSDHASKRLLSNILDAIPKGSQAPAVSAEDPLFEAIREGFRRTEEEVRTRGCSCLFGPPIGGCTACAVFIRTAPGKWQGAPPLQLIAANAGDSRAVLFGLPATDAVFGFSDSVVKVRQTAANFGNGGAGSSSFTNLEALANGGYSERGFGGSGTGAAGPNRDGSFVGGGGGGGAGGGGDIRRGRDDLLRQSFNGAGFRTGCVFHETSDGALPPPPGDTLSPLLSPFAEDDGGGSRSARGGAGGSADSGGEALSSSGDGAPRDGQAPSDPEHAGRLQLHSNALHSTGSADSGDSGGDGGGAGGHVLPHINRPGAYGPSSAGAGGGRGGGGSALCAPTPQQLLRGVALTCDHAGETNPAEVLRVTAAGGRVARSKRGEVEVGPLRVYPGGYAITRALGDFDSPAVICDPEVIAVRLPEEGGRVVIASDGLWGFVPSSVVGEIVGRHVWPEDAAEALMRHVATCFGILDDVSIIVVDAVGSRNRAMAKNWEPNPALRQLASDQVRAAFCEEDVTVHILGDPAAALELPAGAAGAAAPHGHHLHLPALHLPSFAHAAGRGSNGPLGAAAASGGDGAGGAHHNHDGSTAAAAPGAGASPEDASLRVSGGGAHWDPEHPGILAEKPERRVGAPAGAGAGAGGKGRWLRDVYDVSSLLGRGHFASVRLCVERATLAQRALKSETITPERRRVMGQELDALVALSGRHPGVPTVWATFEEAGCLHIVTDACLGGTVLDYVAVQESFTEEHLRELARQLCAALAFCHTLRVFHRDVKPENVMLRDPPSLPPRICLVDFGSAIFCHAERPASEVGFHGTPFFAAPEIFEKKPYGLRADVFSLGVTLYTLVAGIPPLNRVHDTVMRIRRGKTPGMPGSVSHGLRSFIHTLMTVDPQKRPTAEQAQSLDWLTQGGQQPPLSAAALPVGATTAAGAMAAQPPGSVAAAGETPPVGAVANSPFLAAAAAAAAAAAGGGASPLVLAAAGGSSRGRGAAPGMPPAIAEDGPAGGESPAAQQLLPPQHQGAAQQGPAACSFVDAARMSHISHTYERACATLLALLLSPPQCDALVARCRALARASRPVPAPSFSGPAAPLPLAEDGGAAAAAASAAAAAPLNSMERTQRGSAAGHSGGLSAALAASSMAAVSAVSAAEVSVYGEAAVSARDLEEELRSLGCAEAAAQLTALRARVAATVEGVDHDILGASLATLADLPLAHARHVHVQESLLRGPEAGGGRGGAGKGGAGGPGGIGGGGGPQWGGTSAARAHRENLLLLERGLQLQQLWARRHLGNNTFHGGAGAGGGGGGGVGVGGLYGGVTPPQGQLRIGSAHTSLNLLAGGSSGRSSARSGAGYFGQAPGSPGTPPQQPPLVVQSGPGGFVPAPLRRWASFDVGFFDQGGHGAAGGASALVTAGGVGGSSSGAGGLAAACAAGGTVGGESAGGSSAGAASVLTGSSSMHSIDETAPLSPTAASLLAAAASTGSSFASGSSPPAEAADGPLAPPPPLLAVPLRSGLKAASFSTAPRVNFAPQPRGLVVVGPDGIALPPPNSPARRAAAAAAAAGGSARAVRWGSGSASDVKRSSLEAAILLEESMDEGLLAAATPKAAGAPAGAGAFAGAGASFGPPAVGRTLLPPPAVVGVADGKPPRGEGSGRTA